MNAPKRVLISGGREVGGLTSFAANLAKGFEVLGIPAEVMPPAALWRRWRDLRDPRVLKILSTTGVFMAPFARQAICVAHGFPRADVQGWAKFLAILASFRLANWAGATVVAVSAYVASHLRSLFRLRIDTVILNPLPCGFQPPAKSSPAERKWVTFIGRLHPAKNLHRLLPALSLLLDRQPDLRVCVIGDGPDRAMLESRYRADRRIEFRGLQDAEAIRVQLRQSRAFISGNESEPLGIVYLEALSQGCNVVMPACGGGLEIAPQWIGHHIHLFPLSFEPDAVVASLQRAQETEGPTTMPDGFRPEQIAAAYLRLYRP